MTLDEAIQHAEEVAMSGCTECHNEHGQLAEWLKDYREMSICKYKRRGIMEDTIKISDIRPDNPIVVEAITSQGYAIVKHSYLEQCNKESAELARIKFEKKKRSERGLAVWEEEI